MRLPCPHLGILSRHCGCFLAIAAGSVLLEPCVARSQNEFQAQRPVAEAALDVYTPVGLDQQRFAGLFSMRSRANHEGYLEHVDENALVAPFRSRASVPADLMEAEGAGLFLIAAANSYEATDDGDLKAVMDRVAAGVMKAQERDGYLGMYDRDARWSPGDVLTQAATMIGLLAFSHVTGNDEAANAVRRGVDLVLRQFGSKSNAVGDAAAMLPVLSDLYRSTGDARYLNFSRQLADVPGLPDTPLVNALRGYGLVELFRLTGDEKHLKAAETAWQRLDDSHPSLTGVPGGSDHTDSCLTLAWFQLTLDLFRLTGNPMYASKLEQMVYNAILPAQDAATGNIDPEIHFGEQKKFTHNTEVCSTAAAVALSELADISWGRFGPGLAVLSYNPGRAEMRLHRRGRVQLYAESDYPEAGGVLLHVEPSHDIRFPLRLLVPAWTHKFEARVGDTHLVGQPGQFLTITREWRRGDTVNISMEMTASIVPDPQNGQRVALRRGPLLMALAQPGTGGRRPELSLSKDAVTTLKAAGASVITNWPDRFKIEATENGITREVNVLPFADSAGAGIWFAAAGT